MGLIRGILLGGNKEDITHLQYADDTIIFLKADIKTVRGFKRLLQCFQLVSGLKINFNKSIFFSYSKDAKEIDHFANILGCKVGIWPLTFLGDQIGSSPKRKIFWKPLVHKFKRKLASWKCQSLDQAGRLALIKSSVNSLPVYWFSLQQVPKGICSQLETIRRNFFWGSFLGDEVSTVKKMHTLAWPKVCSSKKTGGVGLIPFQQMNMALLAKWIHKWSAERNKSWNVWIREKYGCLK